MVTFAVSHFFAAIIWALGKSLRRGGKKGQTQMGELYSVIQENIQAAPVVKGIGQEIGLKFLAFKKRIFFSWISRCGLRNGTPVESADGNGWSSFGHFIFWKGASDVVNGIWSSGSFLAFMACACPLPSSQKFRGMNAQIQFGEAASAERLLNS